MHNTGQLLHKSPWGCIPTPPPVTLHGESWHGSWQGPFWSISPANPFQYSSVPSSPFQQPHFAVIPPPSLKAHAKKTHFLTRSASFAQFMGLFAPFFKDPYKHPYFLTPHTSPLQRPLQNSLFFNLVYDEESVLFLQG